MLRESDSVGGSRRFMVKATGDWLELGMQLLSAAGHWGARGGRVWGGTSA